VSVKPWVGMWGADAERMVDSMGVKGPGGGGRFWEWYVRREEGSLYCREGRRMRVLVAIVVVVEYGAEKGCEGRFGWSWVCQDEARRFLTRLNTIFEERS